MFVHKRLGWEIPVRFAMPVEPTPGMQAALTGAAGVVATGEKSERLFA